MSLIEAPKLVSIKQKERKKRTVEGGRIIFRPTARALQHLHLQICNCTIQAVRNKQNYMEKQRYTYIHKYAFLFHFHPYQSC